MALKGTTKIQLFDAKTGELTDEVVKENMITNAVPNILSPSLQMLMGAKPNIYDYVSSSLPGFLKRCSPIGKTLFGGILIFSNNLEEDANNIIPSVADRNSIVGYAGMYAGLTGNPKKGSYNTAESIELANGFTHIWEFNTEQANGDIACVALTSAMGGDCGWDTPANNANRGNFLIPITSSEFTHENKLWTDSGLRWTDSSAVTFLNAKYTSDNTTPYYTEVVTNGEYTALFAMGYDENSQMYVRWSISNMVRDINLNQYITTNAFENAPNVISTDAWYGNGVVTNFIHDNLRASVVDNTYRVWHCSSKNSTIYGTSGTYTFTFIDFVLNDDGTVTVKDPVSVTISLADIVTVLKTEVDANITSIALDPTAQYSFIEEGYLYLQGTKYNTINTSLYFIKIAINNPTDITILSKPDGVSETFVVNRMFGEWFLTVDASSLSNKKYYRTKDCVNYSRLDSGWFEAFISQRHSSYIKAPYVCLCNSKISVGNTDAKTARVMLLAPYLATINNLDSVVTKTPSKTMKITYTIQNI